MASLATRPTPYTIRSSIAKVLHSPIGAVCVIGMCVFLFITALWRTRSLEGLELRTYDRFVGLQRNANGAAPRIALIQITEDDIRTLGHWPLSDANVADVLDRLARCNPRAIGLDIYRDLEVPDPTDATGRQRLAAVFHQHPQIVAVMKLVGPRPPAIPPPSFLVGTEQIGFSDILADADGRVRRGLLYLEAGGTVAHALALRLAVLYLSAEGVVPRPDAANPALLQLGSVTFRPLQPNDGGYVGADTGGYQFMRDFPGEPSRFQAWPLTKVMRGEVPAHDIEGKVILIGVTAESVPDMFLTPQSGVTNESMATRGLTLHAQMVSQLLSAALDRRRPLASIREWQEAALLLLCSLSGATLGLWTRSPARLLGATAAGGCLIVALGWWAFALGYWVPVVPSTLAWPFAMAGVTAYRVGQERRERAVLMRLFRSQVSPDVAEAIWQRRAEFLDTGRVRPQLLKATVLFSDIYGFTARSEKLDPVALQDWLNEYMGAMVDAVIRHHGVVDKFIGDAVMAVFGVPFARTSEEEVRRDSVNAVDTALTMIERLEELNRGWDQRGLPKAAIRVGIFTGPVVAGSIGSPDRLEYTVIGDTVNTASRLESVRDAAIDNGADTGQSRILIGEPTLRCLAEQFATEEVGLIQLKGKDEHVKVYRIFGRVVGRSNPPSTHPQQAERR